MKSAQLRVLGEEASLKFSSAPPRCGDVQS
jgi:hypothetical protein